MRHHDLETDLLVIGGGAGGARCAIDAHDAGLRTVLAVKGALGKSGCSIFAGNLTWFEDESDGPSLDERAARLMDFWGRYTHYLGDQRYLLASTRYMMTEFFPWLEERGLSLLRDSDGSLISDEPARTCVWSVKQGYSGQVIMRLMRDEVLAREIPLLEQTTITDLLVEGGRIAGAVALDYLNGEVYVIRAHAVVLATGHNNYLAKRSTGTREGAANGWALGYRAGAELQDIEVQWFHASDIAAPESWMRLHLYPNPMPKTSARTKLYNSDGEEFFDGEADLRQSVPYIMQMKAVIKQAAEGKARFDGGYYTSYRHVDQDLIGKYVAPIGFLRKLGLDPAVDLIENGSTWHMNVGGLRVDGDSMATAVPGLFAAGSVSCLVTGGLTNVMYDGITAAESAIAYVRGNARANAGRDAICAALERITRHMVAEPVDGLLPAQIKRAIREAMWAHMGPVKSQASFEAAAAALSDIRAEMVPVMRLGTTSPRFNFDLVEALDVEDMLDVCELMIGFSTRRRESRGSFYREDFPFTDNAEWLVHNVGRRDGSGGLELRSEPVDLAYVAPKEDGKADFFALDY